jgi:hypothetical protein
LLYLICLTRAEKQTTASIEIKTQKTENKEEIRKDKNISSEKLTDAKYNLC